MYIWTTKLKLLFFFFLLTVGRLQTCIKIYLLPISNSMSVKQRYTILDKTVQNELDIYPQLVTPLWAIKAIKAMLMQLAIFMDMVSFCSILQIQNCINKGCSRFCQWAICIVATGYFELTFQVATIFPPPFYSCGRLAKSHSNT